MNVADRLPRVIVQVASDQAKPQAVVTELLWGEPAARLVRISERGRAVVELHRSAQTDAVIARWSADSRLDYVERDGEEHST